MPIERNRRSTREMAAALAVLGASGMLVPGVLAQAAGLAQGASSGAQPARAMDLSSVEAARQLAEQGRVIDARAAVERLATSGRLESLSIEKRTEALALLKDLDSQIRSGDPLEMGLQRAEMAAREGDLISAERQAGIVASKAASSADQKMRARAVLDVVESRRAALAPMAESMFHQTETDFAAERYASAKAGVNTLLRSGVQLSAAQASQLESYRMQIVEIEQRRGEAFEVKHVAGLAMTGEGEGQGEGESEGEGGAGESAAAQPDPQPLPEVQPAAETTDYSAVNRVGEAPSEGSATSTIWVAPALGSSQGMMDDAHRAGRDDGGAWPDRGGRPGWNQQQQPASEPVYTPAPAAEPAPSATPSWSDSTASSTTSVPSAQDDLIGMAMRAEAQGLLAEADQAFDQARYAVASDKYSVALAQFKPYLPPADVSRAERRLAESNQRLGANVPNDGLSGVFVKSVELQQQQARAAFNNEVEQARAKLAAGDTAKAQDLAARARLTITNARSAFSETEYESYIKSLDDLNREIDARRESIGVEEAKKREADLKIKAAAAETNRAADRDRKVNEAIDRVRALQVERKYGEALQVLDQALFLNPNDPTALLLRDVIRDLSVYQRFGKLQEDKQWRHVQQALDNEEAMVPPERLMDYPTDWPAKTFQRGEVGAFADTAENRRVLSSMATTKAPITLSENRFEDVVAFIGKVSNLPIDADWESLSAVGVEKDTPVTIKLPNVTIETALNKILNKVSRDQFARAGWAVSEGVITVASEEQIRKDRRLVIYNIQDLLFEIPNYTEVPQIDLTSVLQQGQGGSGQSPFTGNQNTQNQTPDQIAIRRQERIRQIVDIIQQNVDFEGWKDNGGETGALQELNGSLIITNTPRNHREIVGLLSKLREIRNMQINVETKFLLVNQNWFEQIGFDLDVVFNTNSRQVQQAQTTNANVRPSDFFNFGGPFGSSTTPRGLNRLVVAPNAAGTNVTSGVGQPNQFSPIGTFQDSLGLTTSLAEGDFANSVLRQAPALGIAGQFLDDIQVDFLIQATQADKRTVQLTAPRLTFTNGQTANIFVVTQQAFVSDLQPITGDSAVGFDPTVSAASEGVTMLIEGVVSSDRRYVTMNVDAGVARIDGFAQQAISAIAGGQLVNSAATQSFIQLPTITVTRVRTTATVPDEGTLLIGGQRLITEVEVETGVPVLSKIPIINRFFTNRLESKEEQTLLILLKPTVLIQSEEEERAHPGLLEQVRSGMQFR